MVMGLTERRHLPALVLFFLAYPLHLTVRDPAVLYLEASH